VSDKNDTQREGRYSDLNELDLFEKRDGTVHIESEHLRKELEKLDVIFEKTEHTAVIYPIEETLFSLHARGTVSSSDTVRLALVGGAKNHLLSLDDSDVDEYHGDYIVPAVTDDVVLKINQIEVNTSETDVELQHIKFKLPAGLIPPEVDMSQQA
jgi:hypothetical protein